MDEDRKDCSDDSGSVKNVESLRTKTVVRPNHGAPRNNF